MLEKLITAKHWQLFVIVFGIPFVAQLSFMFTLFSSIETHQNPDPFEFMPYFFIFYLLAMVVLFSWYYAIVTKLDAKIPIPLKLNMKRFKFFFFFPLIYIFFISAFVILIISGNAPINHQPSPGFIIPVILLIIPLHLFSMFCIGHTFYCTGKSIKLAERQKAVKFEDFAGEFFLAWFYPIGFWIIQPKLNLIWSGEIEKINQDDESPE